jgi:hypothetical protein
VVRGSILQVFIIKMAAIRKHHAGFRSVWQLILTGQIEGGDTASIIKGLDH